MPQLSDMIQALLDTQTYPDNPQKVEMMQTQMSFVFLVGDYVYKVKKPVNLGYLDYTTLEKRQFFCQREVELNQRLCPDAYLGVVPIIISDGRIRMGGVGEAEGEALEYAVKMRHLPQSAMLNVLLAKNRVSPDMMSRIAQKLTEFHQKTETGATINTFGSLETITTNTEENFDQTVQYIGQTVSQERHQRLKDYTREFIKNNASLFTQRIANNKIRDCHGDLHAAHICFTDGICIYDCIEFNDRFRYGDVASEVGFLAMDLDQYGRADLSKSFVDAYVNFSQDKELLKLLDFYKCYRAYVRGKVEGFKLGDPHISDEEKTRILAMAKRYFELAESYIVL